MYMKKAIPLATFFILAFLSCHGKPNNLKPVDNFELKRYLGKWYEIGRYDHSFEKDLEEVTAEYSIRPDNKVKVLNSGLSTKEKMAGQEKEQLMNKSKEQSKERQYAEGYAVFNGKSDKGEFKVTFFWPFFGLYRIVELGKDYEYAVVTGYDYKYLWILSRTAKLSPERQKSIVENLKKWGYDTGKIHWIRQSITSRD